MIDKAWAPGAQTRCGFQTQYSKLDAKYALDTLHHSWNVLWGFPKSRSIASDASLSNSVVIRYQNDTSYRPGNLKFTNGSPAPGYTIIPVVTAAPDTSASAAGG